jgi:hypothetical protein
LHLLPLLLLLLLLLLLCLPMVLLRRVVCGDSCQLNPARRFPTQ